MRTLFCILALTAMVPAAKADVVFEVEGTKELATAWGGLTFHRIITTSGDVVFLTKDSAEQFPDCQNGTYRIVSSRAIPDGTYHLVDMTCQD